LHGCFFKALVNFGISEQEIRERPILSDRHSSLLSVCSGWKHFLLLRHIVEAFGTNSFRGKICHPLAFSLTEEIFISEIEAVSCDILELDKLHALDVQCLIRLERIFGLGLAEGKVVDDWNRSPPQAI
jgi:hypothetical protein